MAKSGAHGEWGAVDGAVGGWGGDGVEAGVLVAGEDGAVDPGVDGVVDGGGAVEDEDVVAGGVELEIFSVFHLVEGGGGGVDGGEAFGPGEKVRGVLGAEESGGLVAKADGILVVYVFEILDAYHGHVGRGH